MSDLISDQLRALISEHQAEVVEFRFTDLLGRWLHVTHWAATLARSGIGSGISIASGNLPGWGVMHDSELLLRPDTSTAFIDPFSEKKTMVIICDLIEPVSGRQSPIDPRGTLQRAMAWLPSLGVADEVQVGPEFEFYLFDDVRFHMSANEAFFCIREGDGLQSARDVVEGGNQGHRISFPYSHFATPPSDRYAALRTEMLGLIEQVGFTPLHHQHEAGPSQQEISIRHLSIQKAADASQIIKYVIQNAALRGGKTATFMPKPLNYVPGSALHLNLSLSLAGFSVFDGDKYAGLSETCLYFIGGVIAHARALNAFLNASVNSYARLNTIYDYGTSLTYSARNRTAPIRIPTASGLSSARIELRFPDPTCNPYIGMAAVLMAGIDGIQRRLDPGEPATDNLLQEYNRFDVRKRADRTFARDLTEAIIALDADREFLKNGQVFCDQQIERFIEALNRQVMHNRGLPHPNEYFWYFST
jgi:glutamine synthetase